MINEPGGRYAPARLIKNTRQHNNWRFSILLIKPAFSPSAKDILRDRDLWRDENRNPVEKPEEMLVRVAKNVAAAERTLA